jgi:hypothetical protein
MKHVLKAIAILATLLTVPAITKPQSLNILLDKLNLYQQKYPEELVYVQSDRCRYAPGDMIWFKAYILPAVGSRPNLSRDLYMGLVDLYGTVVSEVKYLIDGDHVNGDIEIPDQLSPGTYLLMAYTSWMQNTPADRIFTKEIIIEKESPAFGVKLKLNDSLYFPGSVVKAEIECLDNKSRPVMVPIQYEWLANDVVTLKGTAKTDKSGKAQISYTMPQVNATHKIVLNVKATVDNSTVGAGVLIPTPENRVNVLFHPEGGTLVTGAERKIAFRAFHACNRPVDMEGEILSDQNRVMKIAGTTRGVGSFTITPKAGKEYYLAITKPAGTGRTFELPELLRSGVVLAFKEASPDTLALDFEQINKRVQVYHFIGQMNGQIYWMESRRVDKTAEIDVPLRDFPAGVAEIAAFDSVMNPVASRLLYVNQNKKLYLEILPDKAVPGKNRTIGLTLQVKDENGKPVMAQLGVTAGPKVQQQPVGSNGSLLTVITLTSNLNGFVPDPESYFVPGDKAATLLDDLLLVSLNRHFNWKQVMKTDPNSPSFTAPNDSDNAKWQHFNQEAIAFCKKFLTENLTAPGIVFPLQQKNDPASWNQDQSNQAKDNSFSGRMTVLEMIKQIRRYSLYNGKIYFDYNGVTSISNQDGAIIVINGKLMGTDIEVLNGILPSDIDHIRVSTNVMDIQQYTALNTMGVIEIYTKVNEQFNNPVVMINREPAAMEYRKPSEFNAAGEVAGKKQKDRHSKQPGTMYWNPDVRTDAEGKARISFSSGKIPVEITVTVEGITENGRVGCTTLDLSVN